MITIIIPTFNVAQTLLETLASVDSQELGVEIIFIDNGSTDSTLAIIENYKNTTNNKVKLYHNPIKNVSISRNMGIEKAEGEFLLFLDADDLLTKNALIVLSDLLESHDIAFGAWEDFTNDPQKPDRRIAYQNLIDDEPLITYFKYKPTISTALIRKEKASKFREDLKVWEVTQFFLDAILKGAKFVFSQQVVTKIRQSNNPQRLTILLDHFNPLNTGKFLIDNKKKLENEGLLTESLEEVIDRQLIDYCYQELKLNGKSLTLIQNFEAVNISLIKKYKDIKTLGIYWFILLFNGFKGLFYFYRINKSINRL